MNILYEDQSIIVCEKPAGVATQSSSVGAADMVSLLRNHRKQEGEEPEIYPVHRLDQPVGGVMVFAKDAKAAGDLGRLLGDNRMSKEYVALVSKDAFASVPKEAHLKDYLIRDGRTNSSRVTDNPNEREAKEARLSYKEVAEDEDKVQLAVKLETGRHHQIRVQLAHMGIPIVGDQKYGNEECMRVANHSAMKNIALYASRLQFIHPVTKQQMEFSSTAPFALNKDK